MVKADIVLLRRTAFIAALLTVFALASGFGSCSGYSNSGISYNPNYGRVVATPNPLNMGACTSAPFSVSQAYYSGSFTAVSNNAGIVTVAPTSPANTFKVTGVSSGVTTITVTGGGGMQTSESVNAGVCICVRHHDMWSGSRTKL